MLIWAHPAVPDRGRSLAELFRARTEVGLTVYPPNTAPDSADVFDYEEPTTAGPRLLFSVRRCRRSRGRPRSSPIERGSRAVTWLLLTVLALALTVAASGRLERFACSPLLVWLAVRAPVGPALGLQPLFSPATFFRPLLGPLSGSAGVLGARGHPADHRRASGSGAGDCPDAGTAWRSAGALLLVSPYLISSLGRGITPPARTACPIGLWLSWQLALMVSASALIVPTAALFRGNGRREPRRWRIAAGVAIALAAVGHRRPGLESARRMAGLVHLPLDAGLAAGDAAGAALGRDHRHRPGGGELLGAGDLGR